MMHRRSASAGPAPRRKPPLSQQSGLPPLDAQEGVLRTRQDGQLQSSRASPPPQEPTTATSSLTPHALASALAQARSENAHLRRKLGIAPTGRITDSPAAAAVWGDALLCEIDQAHWVLRQQ
mmetsp:Transcript_28953/g.67388  ORF Transcript_28953/g.67388 Transcript_28953/m.67388 type:complete len:122 (-) Transcript_28953:1-366(-)